MIDGQHHQLRNNKTRILPVLNSHFGPLSKRRHERGIGVVEVVLVLGTMFAVLYGVHIWHESVVRNYPGPRAALQLTKYDAPSLNAVGISPDQRIAITVGTEGVLRMHELQTRRCVGEITSQLVELNKACFSVDGSQILVGTSAGYLEHWNQDKAPNTGRTRRAHSGRVTFLTFFPDGHTFLTCGDDLRNIIWDAKTLQPLYEMPAAQTAVRSGCFLPNSRLLVVGTTLGQLQLWDISNQRILKSITVIKAPDINQTIIAGVAVLSNETEVLCVTRGGELGIWDLTSGVQRLKFRSPERFVSSLWMFQDGQRAATGGNDGCVQIWDVRTGVCIRSIAAHAGPVLSLAGSADSRLLISASWDGTSKFWDM